MVPKASDTPVHIDPAVMADWETRLCDFTQWRLPDMDANGVEISSRVVDRDVAIRRRPLPLFPSSSFVLS
jgi:hypothetical protein